MLNENGLHLRTISQFQAPDCYQLLFNRYTPTHFHHKISQPLTDLYFTFSICIYIVSLASFVQPIYEIIVKTSTIED